MYVHAALPEDAATYATNNFALRIRPYFHPSIFPLKDFLFPFNIILFIICMPCYTLTYWKDHAGGYVLMCQTGGRTLAAAGAASPCRDMLHDDI